MNIVRYTSQGLCYTVYRGSLYQGFSACGGAKVQVTGHRSGHRLQATGHRSGYRPQVTGHRSGYRSQVTGQVTGHTKNNRTLDKTDLD